MSTTPLHARRSYSEFSDSELVAFTRDGETAAYAELWSRYSARAFAVARRLTSSFEPADLVSEAFVRVLDAVRRGGGPTGSFSGYLYSTIRNVAMKWARKKPPLTTIDDFDELIVETDPAEAVEERTALSTAFRSLPDRWREALWYSEVEGFSSAELAVAFGITPAAAAMLTSRARQGLRKAWNSSAGGEYPSRR